MLQFLLGAGFESKLPIIEGAPPQNLNFKWRNQRQLRKRRRVAAACAGSMKRAKQVHRKRLRGKTR